MNFDQIYFDVSNLKLDGPRIPKYNPETQEHLWVMHGTWQINTNTEGDLVLDHENMISLLGPGCFYCVKIYSEEVAAMKCEGERVS